MKSQIFVLIFILIFIIIATLIIFSIYIFNTIYVSYYLQSSQKENIDTMLTNIILNYKIDSINLTLKDAILYTAISKNEIINNINITEEITKVFNKILKNKWKLIVEENVIINAWVVKTTFHNATPWNYDTSIYPDFEDNLGNKWYYENFNDSSWIYAVIPFYQGKQIERVLKISKKKDLQNTFPDIFTVKGLYILNKEINPLDFLRQFEACYYLGDTYKPKIEVIHDENLLPKEIEIGEFAYYNISDSYCNIANNYRELNTSVFKSERYYNAISDIEEIVKSLNLEYNITVSYMRGRFYVPIECEEVYLEAIWNELFKLYVNGIFLFATCYNKSENTPKYQLPKEFCINNPKFQCINGIPTWGILKVNITNYVKKDKTNVIAMFFGVPHDRDTIPPCFNDIKKYIDIEINTLGSVRIYCISKTKNIIELNHKTRLPSKKILEIGYNPPNNKNIFVIEIPKFSKEIKTDEISIIYIIKLIYW